MDFQLQEKKRPKLMGKADIVLLCDSTGSMNPTREGLLSYLNTFIDSLLTTQTKNQAPLDWRIKFFTCKDMDVDANAMDFSGEWMVQEGEVKNAIQSRFLPEGGGDEPESTLDAMFKAAREVDWSPDRTHIMMVFTDASTKPLSVDASKGVMRVAGEIISNRIYTFLFAPEDPVYRELESNGSQAGKSRFEYSASFSRESGLKELDWENVLNKVGKTVSNIAYSGPEKS